MEKQLGFFLAIGTIVFVSFLLTNGFGMYAKTTGLVAGSAETSPTYGAVEKGVFTIAAAEITSAAKWFEYEHGGKTIKFFAVRASDGSIKTAFDACDVCYKSNKGYRQEGNDMVCNNCGNHYPIDGLGTKNKRGGGCWPGYLSSKIQEGQLVIQEFDIEEGAWRFA